MPKLSDAKNPEFERRLEEWEQYAAIIGGGPALAAHLPPVSSDETAANYKRRQDTLVDLVVGRNAIQEQQDILTLSEFDITTTNPTLSEFITSGVDGKVKTLRDFMIQDVLSVVLGFGRAYVVIDRARIEGQLTAREAESAPMPFAYVLTPLEVPAWTFADSTAKTLGQVVTVGGMVTEEDVFGFPKKTEDVWTLWTPEEIRTENRKGSPVGDVIPNAIGKTPVLCFEIGSSLFSGLWGSVLTTLQHFSMASTAGQNQVYGHFVFKTNREISKIDIGVGAASVLDPGDDVTILTTPIEGIEENMKVADRTLKHIKRQMREKIFSMGTEAVQQSGISKMRDLDAQESFSRFLVGKLEEFSKDFIQLAARFFGQMDFDPDEVSIEIPEQFVSQDRDADRRDAEFLSVAYQPRTRRDFVAAEKYKRKLSGIEQVMTREELEAADAELEEVAERRFSALDISADDINLPNDGNIPEDVAGDGDR